MDEQTSVFVCKGCFSFGGKGRTIGVYSAGALFAMAWWIFVDGLCTSETGLAGFEDWAGGITTTFGLIVISLIDKEALRGTDYDDHIPWRARLFLFLGFAFMAGGLAGSVAVLVVKYTSHMIEPPVPYLGVADVLQTCLLMTSAAVLWVSQKETDSYMSL
ncbi:uncharacterized protein BX664DRAFT_325299 [Halteromyces radiatus]|uniref:uncharacterized protein n=1 Tax=Halteromyces radiatus TaxID=101107 RepID=UPI00221EA4D9|nr:uncharacterized protein BX664DRAFT_325299 [Halteromyces radiatus]KAI8096970.1 hypothetical protein BX664DRAFT_325299 [Halteromyces radiatus]